MLIFYFLVFFQKIFKFKKHTNARTSKKVMDMKEKFRCGRCNYQFFMTREPKACPYCAQVTVVREQDFFNVQREIENL